MTVLPFPAPRPRPEPQPAWRRSAPLSVPAAAAVILLASLFLWSVAGGVIALLRWVLG